MTVDELIKELQDIKELHPMAGRLPIIKHGKKRLKGLYSVKNSVKGSYNGYGYDCVLVTFE